MSEAHVTEPHQIRHACFHGDNMGAVVGTLTMQTKQRRPSKGRIRAETSMYTRIECILYMNTANSRLIHTSKTGLANKEKTIFKTFV